MTSQSCEVLANGFKSTSIEVNGNDTMTKAKKILIQSGVPKFCSLLNFVNFNITGEDVLTYQR